jgi:hypothetical protein
MHIFTRTDVSMLKFKIHLPPATANLIHQLSSYRPRPKVLSLS